VKHAGARQKAAKAAAKASALRHKAGGATSGGAHRRASGAEGKAQRLQADADSKELLARSASSAILHPAEQKVAAIRVSGAQIRKHPAGEQSTVFDHCLADSPFTLLCAR
jgi:hypothetical protein